METIYQTIVKDCGCDVGAFDKKNFLITFGHKTLVTLKDFCYFIDVTPLKKKIWAGDILKIDDQEYEILRIGEIASDNLAARSKSLECKQNTSPGYASRPGERSKSYDSARYATACLERSSYTIRTSFPLYMKYSASAVPAYGAMYCKDADSLAVEESTME